MRTFIWSRRGATAWAMLAATLAASVFGWQVASDAALAKREEEFEARASRLVGAIEKRMEVYVVALRAAAAFVESSEVVTREEWRGYVGRLNIADHYPGIQGLGYTVAFSVADYQEHVAAVRASGYPDYRVWPEEPRDLYSSILYLEPLDWRNQRAIGYDMFSEPTRRAAMVAARDSGNPAASGRVELVQETHVAPQPGFLVYFPVYGGSEPTTAEERRDALHGWVYSPFRMGDLMQGIYGSENADVHIRVYDGEESDTTTKLHDSFSAGVSPAPGPSPLFATSVQIVVAGRPWTLVVTSTPAFESGVNRALPHLTLLGGLTGAMLLFVSVAAMGARRQTEQQAYAAAQHALAEKDVLLKEVHHRVKNSLQIVASMLTMQGVRARDDQVRRELDRAVARVRAVGNIHERLYGSSDVTHVEFATYLHGLCADLQETAPEYAVRVDAIPYQLPTEQAVPLALMCVEMITNAVKHAHAPEHRRAIDVRFVPAADGRLALEVRDYGGGLRPGFSLTEARASLGVRTIQAFALQLNADISFDDASPGARWRVVLPGPQSTRTATADAAAPENHSAPVEE